MINTCQIMLAIRGLVPGLDPIKGTYSTSLNPSAAWEKYFVVISWHFLPHQSVQKKLWICYCFKVCSMLDFSKLLHILRKLKKGCLQVYLLKNNQLQQFLINQNKIIQFKDSKIKSEQHIDVSLLTWGRFFCWLWTGFYQLDQY